MTDGIQLSQVLSLCRIFFLYVFRDFVMFKLHIHPFLSFWGSRALRDPTTQQHTSFLHSKSAWERSERSWRLVWYAVFFFSPFYLVWSSFFFCFFFFVLQLTIWQKKLKMKISPLISIASGLVLEMGVIFSYLSPCLFIMWTVCFRNFPWQCMFILLVQRSLISHRICGCCY